MVTIIVTHSANSYIIRCSSESAAVWIGRRIKIQGFASLLCVFSNCSYYYIYIGMTQQQSSKVVTQYNGTVVLWYSEQQYSSTWIKQHSNTVVQQYSGKIVQQYSSILVQQYSSIVIQQYSIIAVKQYSGTVVQLYSSMVSKSIVVQQ